MSPSAIVIMGVAGAGKTSVAQKLAAELGWKFIEGDDFHSPASRAKMAAGEPLGDEERHPWLMKLAALLEVTGEAPVILSCSALKKKYREVLRAARPQAIFIFLEVPYDLAASRVRMRRGHFFPETLLRSQFSELERPSNSITIDAAKDLATVVHEILAVIAQSNSSRGRAG